jgi:hypothetical protein
MKRHFPGAALALAIPLGLIGSLAFSGQAHAASCAVKGSVTEVRKGDLRIYRVGHSQWVCSTLYGHRIRVARNAPRVDIYRGPGRQTFAYAIATGGPIGIFGSRNLKTGALLRGHKVAGRYISVTAHALVAKRDGSIAYIYSWIGSNTHDAGDTVEKVDKTGYHTLESACLLCGEDINESFLRIVGSTVRWKDGSVVRSAPFT